MKILTAKIESDCLFGEIKTELDKKIKVDLTALLKAPLKEGEVIKISLVLKGDDFYEINCGTAETEKGKCTLSKEVELPCKSHEITGAVVICKNVFTDESRVLYQVDFSKEEQMRKKLAFLKENSAYQNFLDEAKHLPTPMENAQIALENLYKTLSKNTFPNAHYVYMEAVRETLKNFPEAKCGLPKDYIWHKVDTLSPIFTMSSFEHVLSCDGVFKSFQKYYHYLVGVHKEKMQTCIAIPIDADDACPILKVEDCCVYLKSDSLYYCTVCILFEEDGQYFSPIC